MKSHEGFKLLLTLLVCLVDAKAVSRQINAQTAQLETDKKPAPSFSQLRDWHFLPPAFLDFLQKPRPPFKIRPRQAVTGHRNFDRHLIETERRIFL